MLTLQMTLRLEKNVVIDAGALGPTIIGENVMLMSGVHIGHDAVIEPGVTVAPQAVIGGHVRICEGAYIGMNAGIHQFQIIGRYAAIGGNSFVPRRSFKALILPGQTWAGMPAQYKTMNLKGLARAGISTDAITGMTQAYLEKYPFNTEQ